MGSFSIWHWLIVLVIVLLVFGTKKLRNIGSDLGGAVKGFGASTCGSKPVRASLSGAASWKSALDTKTWPEPLTRRPLNVFQRTIMDTGRERGWPP